MDAIIIPFRLPATASTGMHLFQRVTSDSSSRIRHTAREIGITGAAAAVGNATGKRIRDYHITVDKIMQTT
ncbi:hypothetical protein RBB75_18015 [Tunturibacter empetritectus]|uniref:Uncharacterized protein n=1 Tax=Tunturiibacter empetritectus TaxID=3069691 RepID=A0AAU7ZD90_9BACT